MMPPATDGALMGWLLGLLTQIKVFHWAVMSYGKHKALDELHGTLSAHVDRLIEVYLGRYERQPLPKALLVQPPPAHGDVSKINMFLTEEREKMLALHDAPEWANAPELGNILDEMMAAIDQALYLCRLSA